MRPDDPPKGGRLREMFAPVASAWRGLRSNPVTEIGAGFVPGVSEAMDLEDIGTGLREKDYGKTGLALASLLIPGASQSVLKLLGKSAPDLIKAARSGSVSLGDIFGGKVPGVNPDEVAQKYLSAAERGLPLDPRSVAQRARESGFTETMLHGTKTPKTTAKMLGGELGEISVPKRFRDDPYFDLSLENTSLSSPLFGAQETSADIAKSYVGPSGALVPVSYKPGRVLEASGRYQNWQELDPVGFVRDLKKSGVSNKDIEEVLQDRIMGLGDYDPSLVDLMEEEAGEVTRDFVKAITRRDKNFLEMMARAGDEEPLSPVGQLFSPMSTDQAGVLSRNLGFDTVKMKKVMDDISGNTLGDIVMLTNPAGRARYTYSPFDPANADSRSTIAGLGGILAGGAGARYMMNRDREEEQDY